MLRARAAPGFLRHAEGRVPDIPSGLEGTHPLSPRRAARTKGEAKPTCLPVKKLISLLGAL